MTDLVCDGASPGVRTLATVYARVLAKEGITDPADLHLIGSWQQVLDGLATYVEAGASDLRIEVSAHTEATRMALAEYLSA